MTLISFVDAATMESVSSRTELSLQSTPASVVRVENQAPVAAQPATFLAVAESVSHEDAHTSDTSCPQSPRGDASRSSRACSMFGGRSQHVWWCGECRDGEPEEHDPPGKGSSKNSSTRRPHQKLRRLSRSGQQKVGEGRGGGGKGHRHEAICGSRDHSSPERFGANAGGVVPRTHPTTMLRVGRWNGCADWWPSSNASGTPARICQRPS